MCCNSAVQLGALTSESFSERMISAAILLVDTYRLHLNDEMITCEQKINGKCSK